VAKVSAGLGEGLGDGLPDGDALSDGESEGLALGEVLAELDTDGVLLGLALPELDGLTLADVLAVADGLADETSLNISHLTGRFAVRMYTVVRLFTWLNSCTYMT